MDEATSAKLDTLTKSLLNDISDRSKGQKPEPKSKDYNPFTQRKVKVKRGSANPSTIYRDDFSRVATDNAADHLIFKDGVWVEEDVDPKTISRDRRTSEAKSDK